MGFFDIFKSSKKTLEQADAINDKVIAESEPSNDEDGLMRQASKAITSSNFEEGKKLYLQLAESYPANKGMYLSQVGVAEHFLGKYSNAVDYYLQAKEAGENESMMDDNVWEACEELFDANGDKAIIQTYLDHFPEGDYVKKANKKLLS